MISFSVTGNTKRTESWLRRLQKGQHYEGLDSLARQGVAALSSATPVDSGLAAGSWSYEIQKTPTSCAIRWLNTDRESGFPVAIMLQYGYSTGTGGYVEGQDYINPAIRPIFDRIAEKVWRAVITR